MADDPKTPTQAAHARVLALRDDAKARVRSMLVELSPGGGGTTRAIVAMRDELEAYDDLLAWLQREIDAGQ